MAAELQLIIGSPPAQNRLEQGWARATLYLDGERYWYGADEHGNPGDLEWTWNDLLLYLARNWSALMLEQGWPLPLEDVQHPGKLLEKAEARWADMPDEHIWPEEAQLFQYLDRHNLSTAMSGANLPMLLWVRAGNTLWLVDEDNHARRTDFHAARSELETIGNQLAEQLDRSTLPHIRHAVDQWRQRDRQLYADFIRFRSGMSDERLQQLQAQVPFPSPAASSNPVEQDPVYLAAARMSRHRLSTQQIAKVMQRLLAAPAEGKHPFQALEGVADGELRKLANQQPFTQGYRLARWLRQQLQKKPGARVDPEELLSSEGVAIETLDLQTGQIDAIACWGTIAPLILLNQNPEARAANEHGRRSTLAHEICHLLVDRTRALPVAEVLGGEMDSESEKRANAFAAEFLLPQDHAVEVLRQAPGLREALESLSRSHGVSKQLAAYQLLNAPSAQLNEDEQITLRSYIVVRPAA